MKILAGNKYDILNPVPGGGAYWTEITQNNVGWIKIYNIHQCGGVFVVVVFASGFSYAEAMNRQVVI